MTGISTREMRGDLRYGGKYHGKTCEDGGGKWKAASTSQGAPRPDSGLQHPGPEHGKHSPLSLQKESSCLNCKVGLLATTAVSEHISFVLSYLACGDNVKAARGNQHYSNSMGRNHTLYLIAPIIHVKWIIIVGLHHST